jgi:PAS domain S-box-containing protein
MEPSDIDTIAAERSEEALRESERRFQMLADNMSQLAWICDRLGNVTWYNRRWLDYTGLAFEDMKGWHWSKVQHPDHLERVVARVKRSGDTGEAWEDTFPLCGKDGTYRWFLSRAVPIRDDSGEIIAWFGTNTDVDDQVRAEEALRDADRRKDEYMAMLAHELRNPLAAISNAVQVLRQPNGDAESLRSASAVLERQVRHMVRQVDDLLDVSRLSQGRIDLRREPVELGAVMRHAVEATRLLRESMRHELVLTLPTEPVHVHGDPIRLAQVMGNILSNAYKFTDMGGQVLLTVEREGAQVVIRVRDTGIGLAADQLCRIFDIFAQVDTSLERAREGLGLGLALARNLVDMHGGMIEARSEGLGRGSEFIVRLPVPAEPLPSSNPKSAVVGSRPSVPRRILVADDNQDSAETLAMMLRLMGHDVDTAHDGLEAVTRSAGFRADVIILDIGMPRLNGYQAARRIREQRQDAPMLVALTGWGQEEDRRRSREAGFDSHLVKPVDFTSLAGLLSDPPSD